MPATLKKSDPKTVDKSALLKLKTWKEASEYYAAHLTPVAYSPTGIPIYSNDDILRLNVLLPDEN